MSKDKIKNSIWFVLFNGIKIYFSNIDKFVVYMLFPVFGQIFGIFITFLLTLFFADKVIAKTHSITGAFLMIILLALPGILIFLKAFWDYLIAYVALSSMADGALTTGKVYDFQSHREVATRRGGKYFIFLFVVGILSLFAVICGIIPLFGLIPPLILWIYFILVFQVFTFEPDLSVKDCFKRSLNLVKGDWCRTFFLMIILGFFSIYIITEGVTVIFDYLHLTDYICGLFDFVGESMPLDAMNSALAHTFSQSKITVSMVSKAVYSCVLAVIISEFSLPIRSICWTLWYKVLQNKKNVRQSSTKKDKKDSEV